ncbi:MAG TPA: methyl-accepting chemotaxis protein [Gammaproteobacteria bacterium]|nr:methyl-accepting chemotaxis protein [Gammaproteobacteria bacterium]
MNNNMRVSHHGSTGFSLNLLSRMTLSQKLSLVLVVLMLPIIALVFILSSKNYGEIDHANKELKGFEYVVELRQLQQHLAEHRGIAASLLSGARSMSGQLQKKQAELVEDFLALDKIEARLGDELQTHEALQSIQVRWNALQHRLQSVDARTAMTLHNELLVAVLDLVKKISNTSTLVLVPDVESTYLTGLMTDQLPLLANQVGILRGMASGIAARQRISEVEREKLSKLIFWVSRLAEAVGDGAKARSSWEDNTGATRQLFSASTMLAEKVVQFTTWVDNEIIGAERISVSADTIFTKGSAAIDRVLSLYDASAPLLEAHILQRISHLKTVAVVELSASLLFIALALVLSLVIIRSITRPLMNTVGVFKEISRGNYQNQLTIRGRDEIAQLQQALLDMQQQLLEDREKEQKIAIETNRLKFALVSVTTNVTVSDSNNKLIFMNDACQRLLSDLSRNSGRHGAGFNVESLIGTSLPDFFPDDSLRSIYGGQLEHHKEASFSAWGRTFNLIISPVYDEQKKYQGRITQWLEVTDELQAEQEINQIVSAANSGDLSQRITADNKQGFFAGLASGINELIHGVDQVIGDIAVAMKNVADGDLTQPIQHQYAGTYDSVKQSVNSTIQNLEGIVSRLQQLAMDISNSASEISSQNQELSHRTSQQASDLETTAASMEEINGTVAQNADNAQEATEVSANAKKISEKGVEIVQRTINAMESISQSSSKIEEITAVIDEIAFQTNLLALNAAVEAAHAGDQGKGFAVVATEVRELASRSSDAAKEIKTLIESSVSEIRGGMVLANQAGDTLDEVANSIGNVSKIIDEIAASNQEQSLGINQINVAVTKIDQGTQENTVLAERTAEIALSLRAQASDLDNMIKGFTLSHHSGQHGQRQAGFLKAV